MRNLKVRKRLAAGKLKLRIRDLRNLGARSEEFLALIGIYTADQLRARGALEAYLALRRANISSSINLLWALAGALDPWPEGTDWRVVASSEQRLPLLLAVESREQARNAVLDAANANAPSATIAPYVDATQYAENWAPGLPFAPRLSKRKTRR